MMVFVEGVRPENPMKNPRSKARINNKLNPYETTSTEIATKAGDGRLSTAPTSLMLTNVIDQLEILTDHLRGL